MADDARRPRLWPLSRTPAAAAPWRGAAAASLSSEAGVDLNAEAVNLVKFQQAFQASGKVMQVAHDIFTSILNLTGA